MGRGPLIRFHKLTMSGCWTFPAPPGAGFLLPAFAGTSSAGTTVKDGCILGAARFGHSGTGKMARNEVVESESGDSGRAWALFGVAGMHPGAFADCH